MREDPGVLLRRVLLREQDRSPKRGPLRSLARTPPANPLRSPREGVARQCHGDDAVTRANLRAEATGRRSVSRLRHDDSVVIACAPLRWTRLVISRPCFQDEIVVGQVASWCRQALRTSSEQRMSGEGRSDTGHDVSGRTGSRHSAFRLSVSRTLRRGSRRRSWRLPGRQPQTGRPRFLADHPAEQQIELLSVHVIPPRHTTRRPQASREAQAPDEPRRAVSTRSPRQRTFMGREDKAGPSSHHPEEQPFFSRSIEPSGCLKRVIGPTERACAHGEVEPGLLHLWQGLVVLAQAAIAPRPGEGAFDHPVPVPTIALVRVACSRHTASRGRGAG